MNISHRIENQFCIIYLGDLLTVDTVHAIEQHVKPLLQNEALQYYLFNFKILKRIDSNGVGTILNFLDILQVQKGQMAFCEINDETVRDIMDFTNLDTKVPVYATETAALQAFHLS